MANPVVYRPAKIYAFMQVAQINDTGDITSDTSATSMTVDAGHRLEVGMDVLIENEAVKVTAINTSTHAITINRAEVTHTSATTTSAATHANNTAIFAWSELKNSNDVPLVQHFTIIDELYKPRVLQMTLGNTFSSTKVSSGILEGVVKQGLSIKVEEGENHSILFTGKISSVTRQQSGGEGNTMKITAYDHLFELARSKIGGDSATINIEDSAGSNADLGSTKTVAAAIKFLIKKFQFGDAASTTDGEEHNTTTTEPVSGSELRFQASLDSFMNTTANSKVTFGSSDITVLYAVKRLASGDRISKGKFGYIFYNDPNITSFSTASNPPQMFNYFPAGFMPSSDQSSVADGSRVPAVGFFRVHNYSASGEDNNGFTRRMKPGAAFDLIKGENLTDIRARFRDAISGTMRETNFELFHFKAQSGLSVAGLYGGKAILNEPFDTTGVYGVEDVNRTSVASRASHSSRVVDSSNNIIGYVQFIGETTSSIANGSGVLILSASDIATSGVSVSAGQQLFFDNKDSGNSITLCDNTDIESEFPFRPLAVGQERQTARMDFGTSVSSNDIRAAIAARFAQKGRQKMRGRFQLDGKYPFASMDTQVTGDDSVATSSAGEKTKVVFTDNSMSTGSATEAVISLDGVGSGTSSYEGYGLRAGHTINKLNAQNGTCSDTYGYLEKVTPKELTFLITTGSIATNDFIRVNTPLRPGHNIQLQSFPQKIGTTGTNVAGSALVTSIEYTETGSRSYSHIETMAHNSQETQDIVSQAKPDLSDLDEQTDDDFGGLPYGFESAPHFTGRFTPGDTGGNDTDKAYSYTSGSLYIRGQVFSIAADDSDNGSVGLGTTFNVTSGVADGEPNTRAVLFFEPGRSITKFIIEHENTFETRNASEGRAAAGNLRVPIGINRIKLGYFYGSPAGETAILQPANGFTYGQANVSEVGGDDTQTAVKNAPAITPNQYGPVINNNWLPSVNSNGSTGFELGNANFKWKDIHLSPSSSKAATTDLNIDSAGLVHKVSSSARYKENIRALEIDTTTLYDLKPSTFNHKVTPEKVDFGLIAEEVEKFVPELVSYNEKGQVESVKYSLLSVLLLQELKKLRQEINKLKNEGKE